MVHLPNGMGQEQKPGLRLLPHEAAEIIRHDHSFQLTA